MMIHIIIEYTMNTNQSTIVMNEDVFTKLAAFPHSTSKQTHTNIYKWKFLDEHNNLKILEFKCGYILLRTSYYYTEELCVYSLNTGTPALAMTRT